MTRRDLIKAILGIGLIAGVLKPVPKRHPKKFTKAAHLEYPGPIKPLEKETPRNSPWRG